MAEGVKIALIGLLGTVLGAVVTSIPTYRAGIKEGRDQAQTPVVEILEPRPGAQSPWCTRVRGSATIPQGKALVIAVNEDQNVRFYFEPFIAWSQEGWFATVYLGDEDQKSAIGTDFTIYALVMDQALADYLSSTNAEPGETWWSAPRLLPPTADNRVKEQVTVKRSAKQGDCPA